MKNSDEFKSETIPNKSVGENLAGLETPFNCEIEALNEEELLKLKKFLFEERVRVLQEKEEQAALHEKFLRERMVFQDEMKALNLKVLSERKRLKEDNLFFDKKMQILQNGFLQLDLERKNFEKERKKYEQTKKLENESMASSDYGYGCIQTPNFFKGVNNLLGLKKRYRDLLKIFHPDNLCGDNETVLEITRQYDSIRNKM